MNVGEWLTLLEHIGAFELSLLPLPAAIEAFSWSRLVRRRRQARTRCLQIDATLLAATG